MKNTIKNTHRRRKKSREKVKRKEKTELGCDENLRVIGVS